MVAPPRQPPDDRSRRAHSAGQVRIIGGQWRGSQLSVHQATGLRPTADRVRETLFNWLAPVLPSSTVLDAFAGSGALGFEAASRGAARVVVIERQAQLAASLIEHKARLRAEQVEVVTADALTWMRAMALTADAPRFDIAFVDPPFDIGLWSAALQALLPLLSDTAWVYVESSLDTRLELPARLALHREGRTRDVAYRLFRMSGAQ